MAAFARRHGWTPARLYWWKKRLRDRAGVARTSTAPPPTLALVPATLVAEAAVVIRLRGDVTIEIAGATSASIAAIVTELARSLP